MNCNKKVLTEQELIEEGKNWSAAQWISYISNKSGVMTAGEFHNLGIAELENVSNHNRKDTR